MNEVEQIKLKIDIVDLLSEYLALKRGGRNYKALCPFHSEKSPSFMVSSERQIWHCFGCGKGGDIFTFLQEYEKMDFYEALTILAERSGVKLTKTIYKTQQEEKRASILTLNSLAAQYYHYLLSEHTVGKKALMYITSERKIPLGLVKKFGIGFAPGNGHALCDYLIKKKGHSPQELVEAGLATQGQGRIFDFFRGRLIFPISDSRGNIIAFSGRALDKDQMPKYINTRDTQVYKKSDSLFGIYFAKEAIRKEEKVILVEGEFDVISAFKEGIQNIVAIKGTALTEDQITLLKRYTQKIMFCFDTDPAGSAAQKRSITLIEKAGIVSSVILPPEGKDPDELLRENPGLFKSAIKKSSNIYDYIIDSALNNENPKTSEGKRKILMETLSFLAPIENEVVKEHYIKKLAAALDTSFESVQNEVQKLRRPPQKEVTQQKQGAVTREEIVEKYLLALMLQFQDTQALSVILEPVTADLFSIPAVGRITMLLKDSVVAPGFNLKTFAASLPEELVDIFDAALLAPLPQFETQDAFKVEISKVLRDTKNLTIKERLKVLEGRIREEENSGDEVAVERLQQEFESLTKLL